MPEIKRVADRERLKPRREPYWQAMATGNYLGFRKMAAGSGGTWLARSRDPDNGKQRLNALGGFAALPAADRFDAAKAAAEEWFRHLGAGGAAEKLTVRAACERYLSRLRKDKGDAASRDAEGRFERWVYVDAKLAATEVAKLKPLHLKRWRDALTASAVVANPHAHPEAQRSRPRARSSINRDMAPLRAALNLAQDDGAVTSDFAWEKALRPFEGADGRRTLYLSPEQRRELVSTADPDLAAFIRAMALLPLRPGALAALTVADFDRTLGTLTVARDKAGEGRRLTMPPQTAAFLRGQAGGKTPGAPLFARNNGGAWDKDAWKKPLKAAALAAGLPKETTAYTLRHSVITDLVTGGLDLLTVAQISGTSVAMIERHYGQLQQQRAAQALAGLAL